MRYRTAENVTDEITKVKSAYKISKFFFWDDTFALNRQHAIDLLRAIKSCSIWWSCTTRVDVVDLELLREMRKAGCISIDYGIETGSEQMLRTISKNITLEKIKHALSCTIRAGIVPNAFLMAGFPDETEDDIRKTTIFAKKTKAFSLCLSVFTPYPGTALFERANKLGLIKQDFDWRNFSHQSFENRFTQIATQGNFKFLVKKLIYVIDKHNSSPVRGMFRRKIILLNHPKYAFLWLVDLLLSFFLFKKFLGGISAKK